ncbi:MAG: 4Fe-4S dicluster domain-containing protein [Chloroflexi bacterium]|nr:4Fe-4S dicluster domain-containing protein [Chloroflexota bacterium]
MTEESKYKWTMVVDIDRCTGCQACVVACQAENNIPLNTEEHFLQHRAIEWMRIERYWEGEYPNIKARFIPILCQHCNNAPCEPVCPVYATHHDPEGLNVQVYPRCVGVRFCANNCPYQVRFFNWFEPDFAGIFAQHLNPDVTIRVRGIIEKCTFCLHRIRRAERTAREQGRLVADGEIVPACAQTCPTNALVFGNIKDPSAKVAKLANDPRGYKLLEDTGTDPNVVYLKKVDPDHG